MSEAEMATPAIDPDLTLTIEHKGVRYSVRFGDITGLDAAECRRETSLPITALFRMMLTLPDIDVIAALVWLVRWKNGEKDLSFVEVAADVRYDNFEVIKDEPDPEPSTPSFEEAVTDPE